MLIMRYMICTCVCTRTRVHIVILRNLEMLKEFQIFLLKMSNLFILLYCYRLIKNRLSNMLLINNS